MSSSKAKVIAVCLGEGGIPKHPVAEARVLESGLEGDKHKSRLHGGADRAICMLSIEAYGQLQEDDVECEPPGAFGENVLTEGLDEQALRPGDRLRLGDEVVIELFDVRAPCKTLKAVDRRFPDLMLGRSGWVCRVIKGGLLRPGAPIERIESRLSG